MPDCGSQCWLCDLPVRFDTYKGCTHGCKYCFVQRKNTLEVDFGETSKALFVTMTAWFLKNKYDVVTAALGKPKAKKEAP